MRRAVIRRDVSDRNQSGFTLIELMMALLIFSIFSIAMYQNFIVTQRSYQLLEGYAMLQENARFSEDVLARNIRMAGYRADPARMITWSFPALPAAAAPTASTFAIAGQVVTGVNNIAAGAVLGGSDTISIRFEGNAAGTIEDCLGTVVGANVIAVNTFYIDVNNTLLCNSNLAAVAQPIADGVEDMQILYGIDTASALVAGTYRNAAAVTAAQWPNVVSVRIAILFNTVRQVPDISGRSFTMLDNGVSVFSDGLRRKLFTTTINLRNRSL